MMKSERIGMAMERVVIVHLWSHVWDDMDASPLEVGLMLPPLLVTGGSPSNPTIFLRLRLVIQKVREE